MRAWCSVKIQHFLRTSADAKSRSAPLPPHPTVEVPESPLRLHLGALHPHLPPITWISFNPSVPFATEMPVAI
ncbi:hypothetical protein CapIbe_011249 [Capra ibex]